MIYAILFVGLIIIVGAIISFAITKKQNINFLDKDSTDTMKGVAIICVVLCHYMGTFGQGITVFTPLGGIGVAIFLILSAYGLNESWNQGGVRLVEKTYYSSGYSLCNSTMFSVLDMS